MLKKIINLGVISGFTAFFNFISTFLIVDFLGLSILGNLAVLKSYLAIGGLLFSIIPNNYSIFQLQDNKRFESVFVNFYLIASAFFVLFAVFLNLFLFPNINLLIIYFFGISFYWQSFFDIKYQAVGDVKKYFFLLLIISILKIFTLLVFYYNNILHSLNDLLLVNIVAQGLVLLVYMIVEKNIFKHITFNHSSFSKEFIYIRSNFYIFKSYYIQIILKRIRDNFLIISFNNILSSETIGLFSLFVKIDSFILGLGRIIESFIMNRLNFLQLKQNFSKTILQLAFLLQLLYLSVGITYIKIIVNQYFITEILLQSFLIYPYIYFLLARVEVLSNYKNRELNIGELIYLFIAILGFILALLIGFSSFYVIFITYLLAKLGLQLFLILSTKPFVSNARSFRHDK